MHSTLSDSAEVRNVSSQMATGCGLWQYVTSTFGPIRVPFLRGLLLN